MVKYIMAGSASHPGKHLLVLITLMHKYYLTDWLMLQTSPSCFRVSEYCQTGAAQ